jgi:hypothetical protein
MLMLREQSLGKIRFYSDLAQALVAQTILNEELIKTCEHLSPERGPMPLSAAMPEVNRLLEELDRNHLLPPQVVKVDGKWDLKEVGEPCALSGRETEEPDGRVQG